MVLSFLAKATAAVALVGVACGANASTFALGTLNTTLASGSISVSGSFTDDFTFTTGLQSGSLSSVIGIVGGIAVLTSGTVTWGSGGTAGYNQLGTSAVTYNSGSGMFAYTGTWSGLSANTPYWLRFTGTVTAPEAAAYSVTLAPVPEPETYAMLLAGLGLIGAAVRRRKPADHKPLGA